MNAFSRDYQPQIVADAPKKRRKPSTAFHPLSKHFTVTPRETEEERGRRDAKRRASI